jgi:hypothetical protein
MGEIQTLSFDKSMAAKVFKDAERRARLEDDDDEPRLLFAIQVFGSMEPSLVAAFLSECSWTWEEWGCILGSSISDEAQAHEFVNVVPQLRWLLGDAERSRSVTRDDVRTFFAAATGRSIDGLAVCFLADTLWSPKESWQIWELVPTQSMEEWYVPWLVRAIDRLVTQGYGPVDAGRLRKFAQNCPKDFIKAFEDCINEYRYEQFANPNAIGALIEGSFENYSLRSPPDFGWLDDLLIFDLSTLSLGSRDAKIRGVIHPWDVRKRNAAVNDWSSLWDVARRSSDEV